MAKSPDCHSGDREFESPPSRRIMNEVTPLCPECRSLLKVDSHGRHFCIDCEYRDNPEYSEWLRRHKCLIRLEQASRVPSNPVSRYEIAKAG